jgi:probable phosphoglycerate mutase
VSQAAGTGAGTAAQARAPTPLLLIRHGETDWNAQSRIQGHIDIDLSERGHQQARSLARALRAEALAAVYASDLGRARQTALPLALDRGLELRLDPRLRERGFGLFEGSTYAQAQANWPNEYAIWQRRDPGHAVPGGESYLQARTRVMQCLEEIVRRHEGQAVALVTHGGVLDIVYRWAHGIAWQTPRSHLIPNACINRVLARWSRPGTAQATPALELTVLAWAQDGHLKAPEVAHDAQQGAEQNSHAARDELP